MKRTLKVFACVLSVLTLVSLSSCNFALSTGHGGGSERTQSFTVEFDSDNGDELITRTVREGQCVVPLENEPVKENYVFLGWYDGNEEFNFDTPIRSNVSLKAKWLARTVTLTKTTNDYGRSTVTASQLEAYVGRTGKFRIGAWVNAINASISGTLRYGTYSKSFGSGSGNTKTLITDSVEITSGTDLTVSMERTDYYIQYITFTLD